MRLYTARPIFPQCQLANTGYFERGGEKVAMWMIKWQKRRSAEK